MANSDKLAEIINDVSGPHIYEQCTFQAPPSITNTTTLEPSFPASNTAASATNQASLNATSTFDRTSSSVHRIVTRFHVVRRADGTGGIDEALLSAMMLDLNYGFRNTPFVFARDPQLIYIDNDTYYADFPTFSSAFPMLNQHFQPGVMSWYVTPNINGAVAGTWIGPASDVRGILMAYNTTGTPENIVTPTHEMAHILQVYHPYETAFATECVNRTNCNSAGDLVCDTPASPRVSSSNTTATGIYFGNQFGPCPGDAKFDPNPRLYMDVGWPAGHILRNEFTQGEMERALSFLAPNSQFSVADLVGPQRPDIVVDCDGNGEDDIVEILDKGKTDLGLDLKPDICQTFPESGDLIVTGMNSGPNNRLRYYDKNTGAWKGDLWNGMSFVHQARTGQDGLVYLARLNLIQRVDLETGRTVDNFIDGVLEGVGTLVDLLFEPSGNILVLDNSNQNVLRYDGQNGQYLSHFINMQTAGTFAPKYMEYGPDGNIYIVGNGAAGNAILRFDAVSGQPMGTFVTAGSGGLVTGQGLEFHTDGFLYVSNGARNTILRYDATTGAFDSEFVTAGNNGGLSNPHSLRHGPDGHLYVASRNTHSVKRYDGDSGAYLGDFVKPGSGGSPGTGNLNQPTGLLFAPSGTNEPGPNINPGMNGSWSDVSTPGQGMFFDVIEEQNEIFLGWFTYETHEGITPATEENTHRWMVGVGPIDGNTATVDLIRVDGGSFIGPDAVTETSSGSAILKFQSCTEATFSYVLDAGMTRSIQLARLLPDSLCPVLSQDSQIHNGQTNGEYK